MSNCILAGGASTNSRGKRPLPPGAVLGVTAMTNNVSELVEYTYADGSVKPKHIITWVVGQWGGLWGSPRQRSIPAEIAVAVANHETPGSHGHINEYALADALGEALSPAFGDVPLACRFFQDGGKALAAAARLVRHATGRRPIASYGYHGAAAEWAHLPNTNGVLPFDIRYHERLEWGDVDSLRDLARNCAAICVEVPALDDEAAIAAYLREVRQECTVGGAIFILDEVVTGFRFALGGAAERYDVVPDIACYGKAMSATGCVSAIVGRRELVEPIGGEVFLSTTFGGAPGPCGVAAATVRWLIEHPEAFAHITHIGKLLKDGLNARGIKCIGQPERSIFQFDTDAEWLAFCSAMIGEGIMVHRPNFPCLAHTEDHVAQTLRTVERVMAGVPQA